MMREMLIEVFVRAASLIKENRHRKRNKPSLAQQLHDQLVRDGIHLPTKNRPMNVNSCANWLNVIKKGRYTLRDALNGVRLGRTGANKR